MAQKKYVSLAKLSKFLDNLRNTFALVSHKHTLSDISDYKVDTALSSTSNNPVANKVVDAEFDAISEAMAVLESSIDDKTDVGHIHVISDVTDLQTELNTVNNAISQKSQVQIVTSENSEVLSTLKIHKLTQSEYEQEIVNGTIDENALYLTPDEEIDLSGYVTVEDLAEKADINHNHDDAYYTETEIDALLANKADFSHNHDSAYDTKGSADSALASAKSYTDSAVSGFANTSHTHDDVYYTEKEIDEKIIVINESIASSTTETKSYVDAGDTATLQSANTYTDNAVAQKSEIQIITWEDDD